MRVYGAVETTKPVNPVCYSFQSDVDVENGALVKKGELIDGEREIYQATFPAAADLATEPVYLVANPAWLYDQSRSVLENEEYYINKAGKAYRVYNLRPTSRFKLTAYSINPIAESTPLAAGQYVQLEADTGKMTAVATEPTGVAFVGKILAIDETGFPFAIGQFGSPVPGDIDNVYGNALDTRQVKALIEVIKNPCEVA